MTYEPDRVRSWFDAYEDREWQRLDERLLGRIRYAIHRRVLLDVLEPGMRMIDVGSGPGRFAIDAVEAGAQVTLVDISPEMLRQAEVRLADAGVEADAFVEADVRDLAAFPDSSFDLVLCYGGAISYAYDQHQQGLEELVRLAKPGASILVSVMTLIGVLRLIGSLDAEEFVGRWSDHMPVIDWDRDGVVLTNPASDEWHLPLALFSPASLSAAFGALGCEVERFAVSNPITVLGQDLERISASTEASARLTDLEIALSTRPGLRDSGEHLIALARKSTT